MLQRSRGQILLLCLVTGSIIGYVFVAVHHRVIAGDTTILVRGARGVASCLADGEFRNCSRPTSGFPVLQYLMALPPIALGASDDTILLLLGLASAIAVPLCVLGAWWSGRALQERRWAIGVALVIGTGPLLAYGPSTFREAVATLSIVVSLGAVLHRCNAWIVAAAIGVACLHQDTAFIFLVPLAALAALDEGELVPPWRRLRPILVGAGVTLVVTVGANQLRFGTFDSIFTGPEWRTPARWIDEMFVSLLAAPNAGIIPFWPAAALLLAILGAMAVRRVVRHRDDPRRWAPAVALSALVLGHMLFMAMWWSPFGWFGWGPRLSVPFTAGFCVVAAKIIDTAATPFFDRLAKNRVAAVGVGVALSIAALPHIAFMFAENQARYIAEFFLTGDASCPAPLGDHTGDPATVAYYFDCVIWHRAWHRQPFVLLDIVSASEWNVVRLAFIAWFCATIVVAVVMGTVPREDPTATPAHRRLGTESVSSAR